MTKTRPGTGALAAVVIAGSAAAGAGVTAALAARHDGHDHRRHAYATVRCAEASLAQAVGVDAAGAVAVEAVLHDAAGKRRKRRPGRCRRIELTGDRVVVVGDLNDARLRARMERMDGRRAQLPARLRLNDATFRWRLDQAEASSAQAKARMEFALERMEHAMERLERQVTTAQRQAQGLASKAATMQAEIERDAGN